MIAANENFDGTWPYEARYFEGNGFRQHYIDEGPRDTGETFVLLHGEQDKTAPAMGAEFMFRMIWPSAPIVKLLSASHYVQEDAPEASIALIEIFVQASGSE